MVFIFKDKSEVKIAYKTTFVSDKNEYIKIYEYYDGGQKCNKYFELTYPENTVADVTFIGYFIKNDFYIVNIKDDINSEELLRQRQTVLNGLIKQGFIDSESMLRVPKFVMKRKMKTIENIKIVSFSMCFHAMDLEPAKEKLSELTSIMRSVTKNDTLNFDLHYIYNVDEFSKVSSYHNRGNVLLLCLYSKNQCVGSLLIEYGARNNELKIDSKTNEEFQGRKINKLLRSVIVIIGNELIGSPNGFVLSFPINPISAHIMIKYLNGIPLDTKGQVMDIKTYKEIEYVVENVKLSKVVIELNKSENIDNANDVFMKCLKDRAFDFRNSLVKSALRSNNKLETITIGKLNRRKTKKKVLSEGSSKSNKLNKSRNNRAANNNRSIDQ